MVILGLPKIYVYIQNKIRRVLSMNKKVKFFLINALVFILLFSSTMVYAATGDFTMSRRVVNGYANRSYTYSSKVSKTISCNAKYDFSNAPDNYDHMLKNNILNVALYKKSTTWYGATIWTEENNYKCSYSSNKFTLNKSVSLNAGTYGFMIWRPYDDEYVTKQNKHVGYIRIKGNVKFK